jgi:hypothetical protein
MVALLASACGSNASHLFIDAPWPTTQVAVLLATDQSNAAFIDKPRVINGAMSFAEIALNKGTPFRLHVKTFAMPPTGPDFAKCGVVIGGSGEKIDPEEVLETWVSDAAVAGTSTTVSFHEIDPLQSISPDLRYADLACSAPAYPCDQIRTTSLTPSVPDTPLYAAAAIDDETAFVAVYAVNTASASMLMKVTGSSAETLSAAALANEGKANSVALDHRAGVYFATEGAWLAEMDLSGRLLGQRPYLPAGAAHLTSGSDGLVIAYGDSGLRVLSSSTSADASVTSLGGATSVLALSRKERIFAINGGFINHFDGSVWRQEHELGPITVEQYYAMSADEAIAVAVGRFGKIVVRDQLTQADAWRYLDPSPQAQQVHQHGVATLGRGRFLSVGDHGSTALWTRRDWCYIDLHITSALRGVAASPSGRVAWVVGDQITINGQGAIVRFDFPDVP